MRVVFLVPGLREGWFPAMFDAILYRSPRAVGAWMLERYIATNKAHGGTLNLLRHCEMARRAGFDAVIATTSGHDDYGEVLGPGRGLPCISWSKRRPNDICVIPDFVSRLADGLHGRVIVYEQSPLQLKVDFDFTRANVAIWTDSPFMLAKCQAIYPGKDIPIVPNVVDDSLFPFVPQQQRKPGLLFAFPRKNPEFIDATWRAYTARGGRYWQLERVDGLSIQQLAARFREPQAFLAAAQIEGCALPPQEAMAAGIVVIGRSAAGANFNMQDGKTALIAETPEAAAQRLLEAESAELRETIATTARREIARYFPDAEPLSFWKDQFRQMAINEVGAHGTRAG
jgi:hypothetical protein